MKLSPRTLFLLLLLLVNITLIILFAQYYLFSPEREQALIHEDLVVENKNYKNTSTLPKTQNQAYDLNNWESFLEAVEGYPLTGTLDFNYDQWKQYFFGSGRALRKKCITDLSQHALDEFKKLESQHKNLQDQFLSQNPQQGNASPKKPKFSLFSCRGRNINEQRNRICLAINACLHSNGRVYFFAPPARMMNRTIFEDSDFTVRVGVGFGGSILEIPIIDGPIPLEEASELPYTAAYSVAGNTANNFHKLFEDYLALYGILKDAGGMIDEYNDKASRSYPDRTLALIAGVADVTTVESAFASKMMLLNEAAKESPPLTCFPRFAIGGGGRTRVRYNIPARTGYPDHPNEGCEGEEMIGQRDALLKAFQLPQGDDMLYNIFKVQTNLTSLSVKHLIDIVSRFSIVFGNRGYSYGRHVDDVPQLFEKIQALFKDLRAKGIDLPNIITSEVLFQEKSEKEQAQMMRAVDLYIAPIGSTVPNAIYMGATSSTLMVTPFGGLTEWWSYFSPMRSYPQPFYIYSNIRIPDDDYTDAYIREKVLAYPQSGWQSDAFSEAVGSWFGYFQERHFTIDEFDMFMQSLFKSIHATYFGRIVYLKELCQSEAHSSKNYCNPKVLSKMSSILKAIASQTK